MLRPTKPKRAARPRPDAALFDVYSLVFRAFHALPPMNTTAGLPTSALYGFCSLLLKVLREQKPRGAAFAVDAPARTFRRERFEEYKAGRARAPSDLVRQLERLPEIYAGFGFPAFCVPGFEADDVLATLAGRLHSQEKSVLIVSGDRDMLQLVNERAQVWFAGARGKEAMLFDPAAIVERFGLGPEKLPSYAALVGDASDNLVGAPGIGPKTAARLILEHGSVSALLERLEAIQPEKVREALRGSAERLRLNEELTRLRADVPLEAGPLVQPLGAEARERLRLLFEALEFKSLIPRLDVIAGELDADAALA
jgi:DNA polymerase I